MIDFHGKLCCKIIPFIIRNINVDRIGCPVLIRYGFLKRVKIINSVLIQEKRKTSAQYRDQHRSKDRQSPLE